MVGIYALLALIGGILAAVSTNDQGMLPAVLTVFLFSNLLPLLAALVLTPAAQPAIARKRR